MKILYVLFEHENLNEKQINNLINICLILFLAHLLALLVLIIIKYYYH